MKILQIVNPSVPLPATTIGGVERIVEYLMTELQEAGHEVTFMGHDKSKVPLGIKHIPIGTYNDQKQTLKKVWQHLLTNRYDVIHNHGRLIYFLPKIWSNTRKIHTFHMGELDAKNLNRFLGLQIKNLTFTPCGKWIQDKYEHLGGHWHYVNNGIPIKKYQLKQIEVDKDSPLVIICRIGPGKGLKDAIDIAKLANRKLIIAGKIGDYAYEKEWFEDQVDVHCDGVNIKFIGEVNDSQKNELLNTAAALIIPTRDSEAFNTTMLEANACGCPVISYARYCFPEYITQGLNGFTGNEKKDLIDIAKNIHKLDRRACRAYFESGYTAKVMSSNYLELYRNSQLNLV